MIVRKRVALLAEVDATTRGLPYLESYVINTKLQIADQSQWFEMKTVDRITFRIYFHFTSSVLPEYLQKTCCQ